MTDAAQKLLVDSLVMLLVLSVVFEVAMDALFSWRKFAKFFEGKGWKMPLVFVVSFVVFWSYDVDIFKDVLAAFGKTVPAGSISGLMGQVLTSFLIAGGSSGIHQIFIKLKIRNPLEIKKKAEAERQQQQQDQEQQGQE